MRLDANNPVQVVGIGEDGLAGLRPDAREAIARADVLVGGERHHRLIGHQPGERRVFRRDAPTLTSDVAALVEAGRRVTVLASGDPLLFGIGSALIERLGPQRVRVLPTVSAVQLAFARAGLTWQGAAILSAHGRALRGVVPSALAATTMAILTDNENTPGIVAAALLAGGMEETAQVWLLERLGGTSERARTGVLRDASDWQSDPLNIMVVVRNAGMARGAEPRIGLPDSAYVHLRGEITKAEIRALSVARLAPRAGDVVWDIGAGSGSVSVEAAWFCGPTGQVFAIERDPNQAECVRTNIERFQASTVNLICSSAPECLDHLKDPDAIFIGGSGQQLGPILERSLARLKPSGRLVLNVVTLERLHQATTFLKDRGIAFGLAQVAISRGAEGPTSLRLSALNPVFVLHHQKER